MSKPVVVDISVSPMLLSINNYISHGCSVWSKRFDLGGIFEAAASVEFFVNKIFHLNFDLFINKNSTYLVNEIAESDHWIVWIC